jgi:O-antigen ligase
MLSKVFKSPQDSQKLIQWGIFLIIGLMPFHAFFSVYLGSTIGHQSLIQAWKDLLIVFLAAFSAFLFVRFPDFRSKITSPTNIAIIAFITISLLVSFTNQGIMTRSFWYGAKVDLEFLVLFGIAQFALNQRMEARIATLIITSSTAVALFASLQATILDNNFLANFGFGPNTLLPYQLIDPALPTNIRVLGTLAGPNQLGSFLILPICIMTYFIIKKHQYLLLLPLGVSFFALFHSYSRSAWIGAAVALAATTALSLPRKITIGLSAAAILALVITFTQRQALMTKYPKLQYYLLHSQSTDSVFQSSNDGHLLSLKQGIEEVKRHPLGQGLGAAGPASYKSARVLITENYYLQLAIETGVLGLVLFLTINAFLARALFLGRKNSPLAVPCLSALAGITAVNVFLHGWADSSTALIFWATAGLAFSSINMGLENAES